MPFKIDWNQLQNQLEQDTISITAWFEAFGVPEARELDPVHREELWAQFESVGNRLLTGHPVTTNDVKPLNNVIVPLIETCVSRPNHKKTGSDGADGRRGGACVRARPR